MSRHMKLSDRQFGFRSETGCNMAISVFKETILNYTSSNSNVHCAVLDMSSAFDRINFNILYSKLVSNSTLPAAIANILNFMNFNSDVYINFNGVNSDSFRVGNGARQGGCLSGFLFNFYIDDILRKILGMNIYRL